LSDIAIDWRNQTSGTFDLPTLSLAPGEVKRIRLGDYQLAGQIPSDANWATVRLSYTGRRADLVAVATSYDKTHRYGLQTPFSEDLSRLWAGGMWHVDPTHNTLITTGNGGSEATTAEVTLFYNGGNSKYRMEKMLAPGQQLWLDLGHLIHDQVADSDGNTLPPDTMTGSYELRDLDHGYVGQLYEGKLVIDKTYGHAAYGCGSCCGYVLGDTVFDPTSFVGPVSIDGGEVINATDACVGGIVNITGDANDWGSSDTTVATLSAAAIHTVGVGTATGSAEAELQWDHPPSCPNELVEPKQDITVQAPTISSIKPPQGLVGAPTNVTINGTNFAAGATVDAGPNITVSNVSFSSSMVITATFTPKNSSSVGGNQGVTVSVGVYGSNSYNFYDQVPTHLAYITEPLTPNGGKSAITSGKDINIVNTSGQTVSQGAGVCGAEQFITYQLQDQESPPVQITTNATVMFTESFSNIMPSPDPFTSPAQSSSSVNLASQVLTDTLALWNPSPPACLTANASDSFMQNFTAAVGSIVYPLTTVVSESRSTNSQGVPTFSSSITTP
jgi:hypothetical protein